MKSTLLLLALVTAPSLAQAQTEPNPVRVAKAAKAPMPKAQELLDNLFAPYAAAKTFSGTFDISIKGENPFSDIHIETRYRFNGNGDLEREDTTLGFAELTNPDHEVTLRSVRDGGAGGGAWTEKKIWWSSDEPEVGAVSPLVSTLKPTLEAISQGLNRSENFVPSISRGVDAGRPVFILTAKGSDVFRAVVDVQTRALRSLDLKNSISIRGSNQVFNEPMTDETFKWIAPADFRRMNADEIEFPAFMNASVKRKIVKVAPTD